MHRTRPVLQRSSNLVPLTERLYISVRFGLRVRAFSLEPDASKTILVHLCGQLTQSGYRMMDCQVESPHLLRMGARTIRRSDFLSILQENIDQSPHQVQWQLDWTWRGTSPESSP